MNNTYQYRGVYNIYWQALRWQDVTPGSRHEGVSYGGFLLAGCPDFRKPAYEGEMIEIDWTYTNRDADGGYYYKELKLFNDLDYGDDT